VGTLRQGDLLVEDGVIAAVTPRIDADAEVIDGAGRVVMPGLVDSHRHLWYETLRGIAMDAVLRDLRVDIWPNLAVSYTPEDVYVATRAAIAEALSNGVTTVLDWCHIINTPEHGEEAIRAHVELPIRSVFGYGASMTRKLDEFEGRFGERAARGEIEKLASGRGGALMSFALALQGPESTSMQISEQEIGVVREFGFPMTMHVGVQDGTPPRRSVGRLAEAGLLGNDMQFVHCCSTSDEELRQMADAGATIAICPMAEMALAIGVPPTGRAREAGLKPAFGSDAVCSASGDLFDEARLALLGERCLRAQTFFHTNSEVVASEDLGLTTLDVIEAITINGANACWLGSRIGSLTVGKRADIVVLGKLDLSVTSLQDIQAAVVASAHGSNVETVIVDGEIVKRGGALVGIDRGAIGAALARSRERIFATRSA
jgi:5-methylthioadenosine/S-adenosylhomocysteine deaminase